MNVKYMYSLLAVIALFLLAYLGVEVAGLELLFGIIIPYVAVAAFLAGVVYRVMGWARSAVPFRIPSTCGQQKSLPWIKPDKFENPFTPGAVVVRMILEVCCFRSLFRNTRNSIQEGSKLAFQLEIWLWLAALAFHYAFLTVIVRHLRLFTEPVPALIKLIENVDSFFRFEILTDVLRIGVPGFYMSGLVLLAAVTFLFIRRIVIPQVKYISLPADYFPLFLIFGIAFTRHSDAVFFKSEHSGGKRADDGSGFISSDHSRGHRRGILRPSVFCLYPVDLFPLQQADAHGRCFPEPHSKSSV